MLVGFKDSLGPVMDVKIQWTVSGDVGGFKDSVGSVKESGILSHVQRQSQLFKQIWTGAII